MLLLEPTRFSLLAQELELALPLLLEQALLLASVRCCLSALPAFSARLLSSQLAWLLVQELLLVLGCWLGRSLNGFFAAGLAATFFAAGLAAGFSCCFFCCCFCERPSSLLAWLLPFLLGCSFFGCWLWLRPSWLLAWLRLFWLLAWLRLF
jgi:hypothetical protein